MQSLAPTYSITQDEVQLSATHPVRVQMLDVGEVPRIAAHDHDYFEITFITGGAAEHVTATRAEPLERGHVVVVPPGPAHGFEALDGLRVYNVYYLAEWLLDDLRLFWAEPGFAVLFLNAFLFPGSTATAIQTLRVDDDTLPRCLSELETLLRETEEAAPSRLYMKSTLLKVLSLLSRAFARSSTAPAVGGYRGEVWAALRWVEDCLSNGDAFEVKGLAESLGLSPDHVGRLFREATGQNLRSYYQHRRIRQAQKLLLDPHYTVTEVAHLVGYCDAAHLCHHFKRQLGVTPMQYRMNHTRRET